MSKCEICGVELYGGLVDRCIRCNSIFYKTCSKCKNLKHINEFHFKNKQKNRRASECKHCELLRKQIYIKNNKEKLSIYHKKYNLLNQERKRKYTQLYYIKNKKELKIKHKNYNLLNKEKLKKSKDYCKKYYQEHKAERRITQQKCNLKNIEKRRKYQKDNREKIRNKEVQYRKNNINARLRHSLSSRLNKSLKCKKNNSIIKLIGISLEGLKSYFEAKFQPGMTWNNYGLYGWHIDHIIPISSFDLTNPEEVMKANHYTNLQPSWAKDNQSKGNKIFNKDGFCEICGEPLQGGLNGSKRCIKHQIITWD